MSESILYMQSGKYVYESESTYLTKKPPRTQLPIGLKKTMGVNKCQKCEQIDSKCEQLDSILDEQIL